MRHPRDRRSQVDRRKSLQINGLRKWFLAPFFLASATTATGGTFTYDAAAHAGSGSVDVAGGVVTLHYEGSNGTVYSSATAPTNAGTYQVTATYAGDDDHYPSSDSAVLTIEPKLLEVTVSSKQKINLRSNRSLVLQLKIAAGELAGTDTVASLFNGATFTIRIQQADGSVISGPLTATASVTRNGTIKVSLPMNTLRSELRQAYQNGRTATFNLSAQANDGNYLIDAVTRPLKIHNSADMPMPPLRGGRYMP